MRTHVVATILAMLSQGVLAAPLVGTEFTPRDDGVEAINEPCYVHDAACEGYPVCCVEKGTCISQHSGTVSSNTKYYEGGCQSFDSSKKDWSKSPGCKQQGECLIQHLEVCMGATTKPGYMKTVPESTLNRLMTDSCGALCPSGGYGHRSRTPEGTTTTTTTVITSMTGSMTLEMANMNSKVDKAAMEAYILAIMKSVSGASKIELTMPSAMAASMSVDYKIEVSSSEKVTVEDVCTSIKAAKPADASKMLQGMIGACGGMTATFKGMTATCGTPAPGPEPAPAPAPDVSHANGPVTGILWATMMVSGILSLWTK